MRLARTIAALEESQDISDEEIWKGSYCCVKTT
ncbi:hypothetical protein ACLM5H_21960 [Fredinandcohnia humi]